MKSIKIAIVIAIVGRWAFTANTPNTWYNKKRANYLIKLHWLQNLSVFEIKLLK